MKVEERFTVAQMEGGDTGGHWCFGSNLQHGNNQCT